MLRDLYEMLGNFVWSPVMLAAFLGVGFYFSARSGFYQITHIREWISGTFVAAVRSPSVRKSGDKGAVSQWSALCGALAACMGTGNIAGVATALRAGGAGALFWMCASAVFGMMTCCAENILGVKYRVRNQSGEWCGGAMYYISRGLGMKKTARAYALLLALVAFGMGNAAQSNSIACVVKDSFGVEPWITGLVIAALCGAVTFGGLKRIAAMTQRLIPAATVIYIVACAAVIIANSERFFPAIGEIFGSAFGIRALAGGAAGEGVRRAIRYGVARGVFSNEAGLGSGAVIHSAADSDTPMTQGMWGIAEVFVDTVLMCSMTGLAVLTSRAWSAGTRDGAALTSAAFSELFGGAGEIFICAATVVFAFSTVTGWSYYGEKGAEFLFPGKSLRAFRPIFAASVFPGCVMSLEMVWGLSDIFNGLMAVPNLLALVLLSREVCSAFYTKSKGEICASIQKVRK